MKKRKCGRFEFYDYQAEIKDIIYLAKDEFECNLKDIKKNRPITTGLVA